LLNKKIKPNFLPELQELSSEESTFLKDRKTLAEAVASKEDHFLNW
jgi:hypothetical protein